MCTYFRGLHGSTRLHGVILSGITTCNLINHSVKVTVKPSLHELCMCMFRDGACYSTNNVSAMGMVHVA